MSFRGLRLFWVRKILKMRISHRPNRHFRIPPKYHPPSRKPANLSRLRIKAHCRHISRFFPFFRYKLSDVFSPSYGRWPFGNVRAGALRPRTLEIPRTYGLQRGVTRCVKISKYPTDKSRFFSYRDNLRPPYANNQFGLAFNRAISVVSPPSSFHPYKWRRRIARELHRMCKKAA